MWCVNKTCSFHNYAHTNTLLECTCNEYIDELIDVFWTWFSQVHGVVFSKSVATKQNMWCHDR